MLWKFMKSQITIKILKREYQIFGGHFEARNIQEEIERLEEETTRPNFWNDRKKSQAIFDELNSLKKTVEQVESLKKEILEHIEMLELIKETPDLEIQELLSNDVDSIRGRLESLEIMVLLDGKYDSLGAILEIHSGAGGTEACDWANMLYRMYTRWCEKHGFHIEEINNEAGDEAGIKSVMAFITGKNAFGY